MLNKHIEDEKRRAQIDCRSKVKTWHKASAELFRYLRDPEHPKASSRVLSPGLPPALLTLQWRCLMIVVHSSCLDVKDA